MDIIISGNQEIMRMIKEIDIDESNRVKKDQFINKAAEIANGNHENEI